jgi:hypothetical protein
MMPTFPSLPLKFRTVGFPQSGFKAGISGGAFPVTTSPSCCAVCLRPSCTPLPTSCPRSEPRDAVRWHTSVQAAVPLYPRGPRSSPGYSVPDHHHLIGPMRPTRRHISISPTRLIRDALAVRHTSTPRRPASGSVLSLAILCRHVALRDPGKPVGCLYPVPSPTALAFDLLGRSRHFLHPPPSDSRGGVHFGA